MRYRAEKNVTLFLKVAPVIIKERDNYEANKDIDAKMVFGLF